MTSQSHDESAEQRSGDALGGGVSPAERLLSALKAAAFWTAVFLPFAAGAVYLNGLESSGDWRLFAALAATSVAALYLGHARGEP